MLCFRDNFTRQLRSTKKCYSCIRSTKYAAFGLISYKRVCFNSTVSANLNGRYFVYKIILLYSRLYSTFVWFVCINWQICNHQFNYYNFCLCPLNSDNIKEIFKTVHHSIIYFSCNLCANQIETLTSPPRAYPREFGFWRFGQVKFPTYICNSRSNTPRIVKNWSSNTPPHVRIGSYSIS